jgi:hypothetical protein
MSEDQDFQKHHLPKPCTFCGQAAGYAPLEEMEYHGVGVYFCHTCNAEYLYYQSGEMASTSLYTEIHGRMYRWTVSIGRNSLWASATLWYVEKPGIPGKKKNEGLVPVKDFENPLPDVNPQNINEKLKTWLVFL